MSETSKKAKKNLFERENRVLRDTRKSLEEENADTEFFKERLESISNHYEDLLDQSKLITKVSDRLQKKITKANDQLERKNVELQLTLDALTKAKVGRRATTITILIFLALVLISEGFIEEKIEDGLRQSSGWLRENEFAIGLMLKAGLALLLRPIEKIVEKILLKEAEKKRAKELAAS